MYLRRKDEQSSTILLRSDIATKTRDVDESDRQHPIELEQNGCSAIERLVYGAVFADYRFLTSTLTSGRSSLVQRPHQNMAES